MRQEADSLTYKKKGYKMIQHILFLGLNDKDSKVQEVSTLDAYKITMRAVIRAGYTGATITEATGFYTHENGTTVIEKSLRIEILDANDRKTSALIEDLKTLFNQESVLLEKHNTSVEFV